MNGTVRLVITSPANPRVKEVVRLRTASHRRESGRFVIDGKREIRSAILAGYEIETLFVPAEACEAWSAEERAWTKDVREIQPLGPRAMERVSYGQRQRDWVAIGRMRFQTLEQLDLPRNALILVLDRVEKPGNLGACMRTAAACGVAAVILTDSQCDPFNPNVIRASRGANFAVPWVAATADEAIAFLRSRDIKLFCARPDDTATSLWQCDFRGPTAICVGNEAEGLQPVWSLIPSTSFHIPMRGVVDSLNVSISAALTLYEAVRQRDPSLAACGDHTTAGRTR